MKKRIIAILLAVAVAAGGEGTLAQAASVPIEMMTGRIYGNGRANKRSNF